MKEEKQEQQPFVANVRVDVVAYRPFIDKKRVQQFEFALIEKASFSTELSSTDMFECQKEVVKLLTKTEKTWPPLRETKAP
jgi:hypothetical protein